MHCRLLVPDLWPPDSRLAGALEGLRFPKLEMLMARGRSSEDAWRSLDQWLLEAFGVARQADWPSAPFAFLGEGRAPGDAFWMHADPVHLRADRDRLLVADPSLLELTADEAASLVAAINGHFGDSLSVDAAHPDRWYARLASPPAEPTTALAQVAGGALETAAAPLRWHALMNEVQMLLHAHPVNEAREARGAPTVSGVWFWGGGRLGEARSPGLRSVLSDEPLARGLAAACDVHAAHLPRDAQRWLEQGGPDGVHLIVFDRLSSARRRGALSEWAGALEALERDWCVPLAEALRRGRIGMVSLHLGGHEAVLSTETTRSDLRHFWRRPRALAQYARPL